MGDKKITNEEYAKLMSIPKKLIETDSKFLEKPASMIPYNGNDWYYMGSWFKKVSEGVFEEYGFNEIPKGLIIEIQKARMVTDKLLGIEQKNIATEGMPLHITLKSAGLRKDFKYGHIKQGNPIKDIDGRHADELIISAAMFNKQDVEDLINLLQIAKHCFTK